MISSLLHAYRNNFLQMLLQNLRCKKKIKNNKQAIIENDTDHRRSWDDELVTCILGDKIVERLNLFHCINLSHISKSWRSAVIQRKKKIKTAQVPWLVLSSDHHQPRTTSLKFFDFTLGCFGNISLPTTLFGWWYCGSSKGWLVIAKGWYFNPKLVLYNPISGVQLQLPRLRTIPSFKDFLREKKYDDYDITHFIEKIDLSCSCEDNSNNCIVAASFYNQSTLALCRPGDKSWRIFNGSGADHRSIFCEDILFYKGILYALINYDDNDADAAVVETHDHSMRIGDDDNDQVDVVVKLIPFDTLLRTSTSSIIDPADPNIWVPVDDSEETWIVKNVGCISYLMESNGELLVVHRIMNFMQSIIDLDAPHDGVLNEDVMTVAVIKVLIINLIIIVMMMIILPTIITVDWARYSMYAIMFLTTMTTLVIKLVEEDYGDIYDHNNDEDDHNNDEEHNDNEDDEDNDDLNDHNEDEEPDDNEDEEDDDDAIIDFNYIQTSKFEVFKIDYPSDNNNNNMSVTRLKSLGDRMLFVSKSGSVSVQVSKSNDELKKNCIFFVEEELENYPTTISRESGIFYLENERIERSLPSINHMSWFSPNLL